MILKFILIFFLVALLLGFGVMYRIANFLFGVSKHMGDTTRKRSKSSHVSYGDKETVVDHRTPENAGRKIIKEDDGEYIDFTEES